jgi:hypothetical protein
MAHESHSKKIELLKLLTSCPQSTGHLSKNRQMGLYQIKKLLHSQGKSEEKT